MLETMSSDVPYRKDVASETVIFENGCMGIPELPGLGVDINEEEIAKHPYIPRNLRHYAGTLTDIRPGDAQNYFAPPA
jgi:galactonate dehydratase